jgi:hypothetical protein
MRFTILPKELGGLKLLDLELEIKAFLAKLFIRGLIPRRQMAGTYPLHIFVTKVRESGSNI